MQLKTKPNFEEAADRWEAFWRGEVLDRPPVCIVAPKDGAEPAASPGQLFAWSQGPRRAAEQCRAHAATHAFLGEAIPFIRPGFGPDTYAALMGAQLRSSPESSQTNWAVPCVEDWDAFAPSTLDDANSTWRDLLEFARVAAEVGEGVFLVGQADLHGNLDALSALRGPENLCLDLLERPEAVARALEEALSRFPAIYGGLWDAGKMAERGSIGWIPAYARGRFCTLQCDFLCMVGPAMARRFVFPALEREAACVDHAVFHYDGPGALGHLDDVCALPGLEVIQWVPGAGDRPRHVDWLDLLKDIQSRGKGLHLSGRPEEVKTLRRELRPEKVFFDVQGVRSQREGEELLKWFARS